MVSFDFSASSDVPVLLCDHGNSFFFKIIVYYSSVFLTIVYDSVFNTVFISLNIFISIKPFFNKET